MKKRMNIDEWIIEKGYNVRYNIRYIYIIVLLILLIIISINTYILNNIKYSFILCVVMIVGELHKKKEVISITDSLRLEYLESYKMYVDKNNIKQRLQEAKT